MNIKLETLMEKLKQEREQAAKEAPPESDIPSKFTVKYEKLQGKIKGLKEKLEAAKKIAEDNPKGFYQQQVVYAEQHLRDAEEEKRILDLEIEEFRTKADNKSNEVDLPEDLEDRAAVLLPMEGVDNREFLESLGEALKDKQFLFESSTQSLAYINTKQEYRVNNKGVEVPSHERMTLMDISSAEAESMLEDYVMTGILKTDNDGNRYFVKKSIPSSTASMLIAAPRLIHMMPKVRRILNVTIPIATEGGWVVPRRGYNPDLEIILDTDIKLREMPLQDAKDILADIIQDFPFADDDGRSLTNWYARLITPMCRGIMGFRHRVPLFMFMSNRPRAGKDYLNGVAQTLYYGTAFEDPPLILNDKEETKKLITTAIVAERQSMHFANQEDPVMDEGFIRAITETIHFDRKMGGNSASNQIVMPNELEITMSGNDPLGWRPDLPPRMRIIRQEFYEEDENARCFKYVDLHGEVLSRREEILCAVYSHLCYWKKDGCCPGNTFSSFPRWAQIVAGVLLATGHGDATLPMVTKEESGDPLKDALREVYREGFNLSHGTWITTLSLENHLISGLGALRDTTDFWNNLQHSSNKRAFGEDITKYNKRELKVRFGTKAVKIRMERKDMNKKFNRDEICFTEIQ
jgi:hypothetical protein